MGPDSTPGGCPLQENGEQGGSPNANDFKACPWHRQRLRWHPFQHINLEAGSHHIEIDWGGYEPIAFDVDVRPGETTTFRADGYFRP